MCPRELDANLTVQPQRSKSRRGEVLVKHAGAALDDHVLRARHRKSRVGRLLEREGLLERDTEQLDLGEALDTDDPMPDLAGHSITYRIALGPHRGRKVFTLQTLPDNGWEDESNDAPGIVAGFSLHVGVAVKRCRQQGRTSTKI